MKTRKKILSIILAAGKGKRMHSHMPKVLHPLGGRPILARVIDLAQQCSQNTVVVVGHQADRVKKTITNLGYSDLIWAVQQEQLGTGHAVNVGLQKYLQHHKFSSDAQEEELDVLVLYGDVPLVDSESLNLLLKLRDHHLLVLLTANIHQPKDYGRIIRDVAGSVVKIVEEKDADEEQKLINEVNSGILTSDAKKLALWLSQIDSNNAKQEYYLTDAITQCVEEGGSVAALCIDDSQKIQGINSQKQRAEMERYYQRNLVESMSQNGLGVADLSRVDIRGELSFGRDVFLDINVVIEGSVSLGDGVKVGMNCYLKDCHIESGTEIKPNCHLQGAHLGCDCVIGPFSRIRPETLLAQGVYIGNFVEVKKSKVDDGTKVNHLSYIGDASIGEQSNIGAGTITCNYDGDKKHQTMIGKRVFVGSGSELVAPVNIGDDATIAAGTTVRKSVADGALVVVNTTQKEISGWSKSKRRQQK